LREPVQKSNFAALLRLRLNHDLHASTRLHPTHWLICAQALTTLAQLELSHHAHKMAGRLSGGMKRKLCCAVALVGDPHVVLLDEPSAGLDPVSQRNLWNLIKSTMTGRAVLLTTHSMLEADALCDRIGIQVRGQFHCVGSCVEINQ
jgi:ABC-type multidrug transport system ATPase subunit